MKLLTSIIAVFGILITIALTITPIGLLTIIPAVITIICGVVLFKIHQKEGRKTIFPKIIIAIALLGAILSSTRALLTSDKIADDPKFEQRIENSNQDAVEDLEELE